MHIEIQIFYYDRGIKYFGHILRSHLNQNDIIYQKIYPNTPQQNRITN